MLTASQIRAGRGLLGWSARVLAEQADVHITTIQRLERLGETPRGNASTLARVQAALERAGVEFIGPQDNGAGPGVRLKSPIKSPLMR